jgi:peptidoglycan/xylan/chitin deacetylase (PgdA/CDA1 family)
MDDGSSALRHKTRLPPLAGPPRGAGRGPVLPHHRRRRLMALGLLAACALIVGAVVGAGGGTAKVHRVAQAPTGYFNRIHTLAGNGSGSLAAAEESAENAAIDRTLAYTPYVRIAGSQHREIALTFDDGPGPYTPQILAVLKHKNVPGTFFEIGEEERYFHASTSEIVARGYPIGDHTETHPMMSKLSAHDQQEELLQETAQIGDFGAPFPRMFRPPYGVWNAATLRLLKKYRMLMILWTVDTNDYEQPGVPAIVHAAVSGARPGAIILLHDAGGTRTQTIEALPQIISALRAKGYKLVTVPRLLLDNPAPASQDISALGGGG